MPLSDDVVVDISILKLMHFNFESTIKLNYYLINYTISCRLIHWFRIKITDIQNGSSRCRVPCSCYFMFVVALGSTHRIIVSNPSLAAALLAGIRTCRSCWREREGEGCRIILSPGLGALRPRSGSLHFFSFFQFCFYHFLRKIQLHQNQFFFR